MVDDFLQRDSITTQIYERIKEVGHDEIYIVGDFLDLGEYHAVRKALLRLDEAGKIQKIMRGVYYYPRYSELIDEYEAPSPGKVADTLARKFGWTIAPCADTALNQLGLSTQVTDGHYQTSTSDEDKDTMLKEAHQVTVWVYDLIKQICE